MRTLQLEICSTQQWEQDLCESYLPHGTLTLVYVLKFLDVTVIKYFSLKKIAQPCALYFIFHVSHYITLACYIYVIVAYVRHWTTLALCFDFPLTLMNLKSRWSPNTYGTVKHCPLLGEPSYFSVDLVPWWQQWFSPVLALVMFYDYFLCNKLTIVDHNRPQIYHPLAMWLCQ